MQGQCCRSPPFRHGGQVEHPLSLGQLWGCAGWLGGKEGVKPGTPSLSEMKKPQPQPTRGAWTIGICPPPSSPQLSQSFSLSFSLSLQARFLSPGRGGVRESRQASLSGLFFFSFPTHFTFSRSPDLARTGGRAPLEFLQKLGCPTLNLGPPLPTWRPLQARLSVSHLSFHSSKEHTIPFYHPHPACRPRPRTPWHLFPGPSSVPGPPGLSNSSVPTPLYEPFPPPSWDEP